MASLHPAPPRASPRQRCELARLSPLPPPRSASSSRHARRFRPALEVALAGAPLTPTPAPGRAPASRCRTRPCPSPTRVPAPIAAAAHTPLHPSSLGRLLSRSPSLTSPRVAAPRRRPAAASTAARPRLAAGAHAAGRVRGQPRSASGTGTTPAPSARPARPLCHRQRGPPPVNENKKKYNTN